MHFQKPNLIFQRHAKCIVIEQITKKCNTTEEHNLMFFPKDPLSQKAETNSFPGDVYQNNLKFFLQYFFNRGKF